MIEKVAEEGRNPLVGKLYIRIKSIRKLTKLNVKCDKGKSKCTPKHKKIQKAEKMNKN